MMKPDTCLTPSERVRFAAILPSIVSEYERHEAYGRGLYIDGLALSDASIARIRMNQLLQVRTTQETPARRRFWQRHRR